MEQSKYTKTFFTNSIIDKKNKLSSSSSHVNLKTIKFAEIYKQLYGNQTGEAIKFLKYQNEALKISNEESLMKRT